MDPQRHVLAQAVVTPRLCYHTSQLSQRQRSGDVTSHLTCGPTNPHYQSDGNTNLMTATRNGQQVQCYNQQVTAKTLCYSAAVWVADCAPPLERPLRERTQLMLAQRAHEPGQRHIDAPVRAWPTMHSTAQAGSIVRMPRDSEVRDHSDVVQTAHYTVPAVVG